MPIGKAELQLYWQKFLIGLLSLATSRKFWLKVAADITAYQQLQAGAISAELLLAEVLGSTSALIIAIAYEDGAAKRGAAS